MASPGWVWLARIKRTQGRKGEVFAEILTDFPERFSDRRHVFLLREGTSDAGDDTSHTRPGESPRAVELVHHWLHKGGVVLQFAGVDSISAAEEFAGAIVAIPQSERAQLEEGEVYISDLIGCELLDVAREEGVLVGKIEDVDRSMGPVAVLIVKPAMQQAENAANQRGHDDEILIPFAKEYLKRVDVDAKRVEMALPEGLVELNRPEPK